MTRTRYGWCDCPQCGRRHWALPEDLCRICKPAENGDHP